MDKRKRIKEDKEEKNKKLKITARENPMKTSMGKFNERKYKQLLVWVARMYRFPRSQRIDLESSWKMIARDWRYLNPHQRNNYINFIKESVIYVDNNWFTLEKKQPLYISEFLNKLLTM